MALMKPSPTGVSNGAAGKPAAPVRQQPQFVGSATGAAISQAPVEEPVVEEEVNEEVETPAEETPVEPAAAKPVIGHGGKEMSAEAIAERVDRANKKLLRELTGTDNMEEAKKLVAKAKAAGKSLSDADAKEFERLKRLEEVRKRSRMTDEQRRAEEGKAKEDRIAALEAQLKEREQNDIVRSQDQVITSAATQHIDPDMLEDAKERLRRHVRDLQKDSPELFAKFGAKDIEKWFKKLATDKPKFAKEAPAAKVETPAPVAAKPAEKRVVTTTKQPPRPPAAAPKDGPGMYKGKIVKPGQPNSMNKAELREYAKMNNIRLNY